MEIYHGFPQNAIDRAKEISNLQNTIFNLTNENFYIIQSIIDDNRKLEEYLPSILHNIFLALQLRSHSLNQLIKLFIFISTKDIIFIQETLLSTISQYFIRCHSNYEKHAKFMFNFFSGIFKILDPQFDSTSTDKQYIEDFIRKLFNLNQVEISRIKSELDFPNNDLLSIIYHDDIQGFQLIAAGVNFDFNSPISIENPFLFNINKDMKYIEVALALGSIKIFKFLLLNNAILDKNRPIALYSIQGGNVEVIHIIAQKGFQFLTEEMAECSYFHRNDLVQWIIINHKVTDITKAIQKAALSNNLAYFLDCLDDQQCSRSLSKCDDLIELTALSGNYDFFNLLRTNEQYKLNKTIFPVVEYGVLESARLLKEDFHSCINDSNRLRLKPIHIAAQKGDIFMCHFLIDNYPEIDLNAQDRYGATPLHLAIRFGHVEIAQLLMKSDKVDINLCDFGGSSPLHESLSSPNLIFIKMLLSDPRTNINIADQSGNTPLIQALIEKNFDAVNLFLESNKHIDDICKVFDYAIPIDERITKKIMNMNNIEINSKEIVETIVNQIIKSEKLEYVRFFIELERFNINIQFNEDLKTLLHLCCSIKELYHFIPELLKRKDIDVNIPDINGATPLHIAMSSQNNDYSIYLIQDKRIDVNARDKGDQTPLHYAVSNWSPVPLTDLLLKTNIDPNAIDKDGKTPLFIACELGLADNVEILLNDFQVDTEIEIETIFFFLIFFNGIQFFIFF